MKKTCQALMAALIAAALMLSAAAHVWAAQALTMEQAMNLLYESYVDAELFYPGELDTLVGDTHFYGFAYDDGDTYCYVWVNAMTGGIEFAEAIENYTGEDVSANTDGMSDEELIAYLLASVPEAYERVVVMRGGLTALVTGKTTALSNGACRDVQLGAEDGISFAPVITYTISPFGTIYEHDPAADIWIGVHFFEAQPAQILTMEQAMSLLYENYVDAELFYPGELDKWEGNSLCYGFVYDDGDRYRYVWVDAMTGEVSFADEIEDYTGEGY